MSRRALRKFEGLMFGLSLWSLVAVGSTLGQTLGPPLPNGAPSRTTAIPRQVQSVDQIAPPPFQLNSQEQALLDAVLSSWEAQNARISTVTCKFTRFEYDGVFGKKTTSSGELKYAAPDKGMYLAEAEDGATSEHWVTNGRSIYEFNAVKKQLIERPLPPELQGKGIVDGPLPFLFGASTDKLKRRYYMRVTVPRDAEGRTWIEAVPKYERDRVNFIRAELILNENDPFPYALQVYQPNGKSRVSHVFGRPSINSPLEKLLPSFAEPKKPWGWTKIVDDGSQTTARLAAPPAQAQRPPTLPDRR